MVESGDGERNGVAGGRGEGGDGVGGEPRKFELTFEIPGQRRVTTADETKEKLTWLHRSYGYWTQAPR